MRKTATRCMMNLSLLTLLTAMLSQPVCLASERESNASESTLNSSRSSSRSEGDRVKQWHPLSLDFKGPATSETASPNPFTDYRLQVQFVHTESGATRTVRGYYAADGDAANTHAESGRIWRAKFAPDKIGNWNWRASLRAGSNIAISSDPNAGTAIDLKNTSGEFTVVANNQAGTDFRTRGPIVVKNQRFQFAATDQCWIKGGADSPENFLAFVDFDGTYRTAESQKDGEAKTTKQLHRYASHVSDWQPGDASWTDQKGNRVGRGIVGAINYLASKEMNSVYFLTMNINGDGKDVWPYRSPDDLARFDCSKLDQWEIVFDHMQKKGIALHVQLQETENETLMDNGDTGPQRKLYFSELMARFGHHPALVWNLGEENGPVHWSPVGQTPQQRIAMADYLSSIDPYDHPIVMHTHADAKAKNDLLTPLLGARSIDGLSFQVDERKRVRKEMLNWFSQSQNSGHPWLISMDEIGLWDTGAKTDAEDPNHDTLRRYVLWGGLLGGAAGVEWYFGAKSKHNDLTSEDWRQRDRLWELTRIATKFVEEHLPFAEMKAADHLIGGNQAYCLATPGHVYAVYFHRISPAATIDLGNWQRTFSVHWYDPLSGGELQIGSHQKITGPGSQVIGLPPKTANPQDWVALIRVDD